MANISDVRNSLYYDELNHCKFAREMVNVDHQCNTELNISDSLHERIDAEIKLIIDKVPISFDKSILVCQNSKNPCVLSALITGPADTPYDSACILFDIFLPIDYPNTPPKIICKIKSSYVNPNIKDDGDVKISFLKRNRDEPVYEQWDPLSSTLYKTLQNIQNIMFCENPYLNTKNNVELADTNFIKNDSLNYNKFVRQIVMAEGIYKLLNDIPPEFEHVIKSHFYLKYDYLNNILKEWNRESCNIQSNSYGGVNMCKKYQNKTFGEWFHLAQQKLKQHYENIILENDDEDDEDNDSYVYNSDIETDSEDSQEFYNNRTVYNMNQYYHQYQRQHQHHHQHQSSVQPMSTSNQNTTNNQHIIANNRDAYENAFANLNPNAQNPNYYSHKHLTVYSTNDPEYDPLDELDDNVYYDINDRDELHDSDIDDSERYDDPSDYIGNSEYSDHVGFMYPSDF